MNHWLNIKDIKLAQKNLEKSIKELNEIIYSDKIMDIKCVLHTSDMVCQSVEALNTLVVKRNRNLQIFKRMKNESLA